MFLGAWIIFLVGFLLLFFVERASRITRTIWIVVSSFSALVASAMAGLRAEVVSPSERWFSLVLFGFLFLCAVGLLFIGIQAKGSWNLEGVIPLSVFIISVFFVLLFRWDEFEPIDLSERIASASNGLNAVSTELSEIQRELEAHIQFVEELREQEETSKAVMKLSREQMDMLERVLDRQGLESTLVSIVTMVGGALLGFLLGQLSSAFKRRKQKPTGENDSGPFYSEKNP
jgi:hypothetical protein